MAALAPFVPHNGNGSNGSNGSNGRPVFSVRDFYKGKHVFVTGGSGFAGKSLVERILATCQVDKVYILLRAKKGVTFDQRSKQYMEEEVFSYFKDKEAMVAKIHPVEGDILLPRLGLSDHDHDMLVRHVNIVFHAAASVRFREAFKLAVKLHVSGTHEVVQLCRKIANFSCLVHVSSISAWFVKDKLKEIVYPSSVDPKKLLDDIEQMTDQEAEVASRHYIGNYPRYPNSYIFTKTLAEGYLRDYCRDVKVAVVRLPFIGSSYKEPTPGWFDSIQAINAMAACAATGVLRTIAFEPETKPDFLPVDLCSNALIVIGSGVSLAPEMLKVFNVTPKVDEIPTCFDAHLVDYQLGLEYPSIRQLLPPAKPLTRKPSRFEFYFFVYMNIIFAYFVDFFLFISGHKPFFARLTRKVYASTAEISIDLHKTKIDSKVKNYKLLYGLISAQERDLFYCDPGLLPWRQIVTDMYLRFRRKFLKEPDSNVPEAVARMKWLVQCYKTAGYVTMVTIFIALLTHVL
ncbi:putative fatty acyl-CoA reductase [Halotydeus destructor]|nr:putative fatty acyl-CoA reductase [Halotydeus destructor]